MSGDFTRIGAGLWHWERFTNLEPAPRILWLGLYTSIEAKRVLPGLWHGPVYTMANAAKLPVDETMKCLDRLLDHELVEFDQKTSVLRFTDLPDAGEYPSNPSIMFSWWKRFKGVPACQVRDAHVPTLRWIIERGAAEAEKNKTKKPTPGHEQQWSETFATVVIPAPRRRGLRRLIDADTSTSVQPSLFPDTSHETPSKPPSAYLSGALISAESASDFGVNKIRDLQRSDTLSRGCGEGEGVGVGVSFSSSSLSGAGSGVDGGGDLGSGRPRLTLVPPPAEPFTVTELLRALSGGDHALVREGFQDALSRTIAAVASAGMGLAEVALAGRHAQAGVGWGGNIGGDPRERLSVWAAAPGTLLAAIAEAQEHDRATAERTAMAVEARKALGIHST